jgi:hypothetical protein
MESERVSLATDEEQKSMRWVWVLAGVAAGAIVITVFLNIADRYLDRLAVDGLIGSLTVLLVGILVGAASRGETLREAAVAGLMLAVLTISVVAFQLRIEVPTLVWVAGPFYALVLALIGGYVGEMLQGTLEEAHVDRPLDWPWVFVSIVIGFTLGTYALFLVGTVSPGSPDQDMTIMAAAFLVTGVVVGFFSPGRTMIEPAIAAAGLMIAHGGFVLVYFETPPTLGSLLTMFAVGILLALGGGWMGEVLQGRLRRA